VKIKVEFFWVMKWGQHGPLKQWYPTETLHGITSQISTCIAYAISNGSRIMFVEL